MVPAEAVPPITFIAPHGCCTHRLAHLLDSLVRVSRRVDGQASAGAMSKQFETKLRSSSALALVEPNTLVWGFASISAGTNQPTVYSRARRAVYTRKQYARPSLPTIQFHALFHSLASGLFIVPSRYFFAIGLQVWPSMRGKKLAAECHFCGCNSQLYVKKLESRQHYEVSNYTPADSSRVFPSFPAVPLSFSTTLVTACGQTP